MKRLVTFLTVWVLLTAAPALALEVFPDLKLEGAPAPSLGAGEPPFMVSDIKGDYLLVEAFSLYCPICQRDAPGVNEMVRMVGEANLGVDIRVIGIGAGNTPFEVNFYAEKYQAGFPLFHDEDYVAHKALNNVGTPAFYLVDLDSDRRILYFHEGEMGEPEAMAEAVIGAIRENEGE